ncbi:putative mitochondrial aconitate hydratase [Jaminaea rosea]|uniref:Putative mitochondrial aconitate hydratase n=1 Tax=Jaminaea rosea TaxID=1569628 RepID=A0A316USI7_9BASI|nr:putative mitochondrial aconitate hydratase [Jaminaea rosea]PWN28242.1 putative mitochondrial aconitate hydratase [Jaminaea rosea]
MLPPHRLAAGNGSAARALRRSLATAAPPTFHPTRLPPYQSLCANLDTVRKVTDNAPLSLAEKILFSHLRNPEEVLAGKRGVDLRGKEYLPLRVDRLAMQDASAQMALLQFMTCGLPQTAVPASVHCDHLIQAFEGAEADLKRSIASNQEVFQFLSSASAKYGIEFWAPGSGIIHQIVLENYAAPGLLMLGTDSHTPNASGMGCLAIGVGGADAVDALTDTPWELLTPRLLNVHMTGKLSSWCTPKDIILHLVSKLTVRGGTGRIVEYSGPGLASLPATGLATMSNMGAEVGATTSCFGYNDAMARYLDATGRGEVKLGAEQAAARGLLSADQGAQYDERIEIDLSTLEPVLNGPFTPDLSTPLSQYTRNAKDAEKRDHPLELSAALIGSCTNSSYNDLARCASLARQALDRGMKVKCPFDVTPGSEQVRATVERDGLTSLFESVGGRVLANACGPCIGQWDRKECQGKENVILTSFNRNFKSRNDGNSQTHNMLASPEVVTAMAFAGRLDFNPMTDSLIAPDGQPFRFSPPEGDELPAMGFTAGEVAYLPLPAPQPQPEVEVAIDPSSSRLEHLQPFGSAFAGGKYELDNMGVLMRIKGKCTTDHISAAGPWLKYKGHLSNLAENTLIGATNAETGRVNSAVDYEDGQEVEDTIPGVAKRFKARNQPWVLVADHNYGEGSAREHAALQPRFFGCQVIVARSIARIAETNLRKQGVLTLLFEDEADWERIGAGDEVATKGLEDLLKPGGDLRAQVTLLVKKRGTGETIEIPTKHTLSRAHLDWIRAGSALNVIRQQAASGSSAKPPSQRSGLFAASSSRDSPPFHQARSFSTSTRRRATSSTTPANKISPNDPRYVQPAADARGEALRRMVYPTYADAELARKRAGIPATLGEALPFGAEVHETIDRAWKLFQRERREALREDLRVKRERLHEAVRDLAGTDSRLYRAATYRVSPTKRSPAEQAALIDMGIVAKPGGAKETQTQPQVGAEQRRKARNMLGRRLEGLFPREMRTPTTTPRRGVWE